MSVRKKSASYELQDKPERWGNSLAKIYHENSKRVQWERMEVEESFGQLVSGGLLRLLTNSFKSYPNLPQIELPKADLVTDRSLQEIIVSRRSRRTFDTAEAVTLQELANLLQLSYGITGRHQGDNGYVSYGRAVPSGGALYPLEIYLMVQRVEGLSPGFYHYRVAHHALEVLETGERAEREMRRTDVRWGLTDTAAVSIVISGIFERNMAKYLERGYRVVLFDTGILGGRIVLLAECQDLNASMMAGWEDDHLNRLLGLDGFAESVLLAICVGKG